MCEASFFLNNKKGKGRPHIIHANLLELSLNTNESLPKKRQKDRNVWLVAAWAAVLTA